MTLLRKRGLMLAVSLLAATPAAAQDGSLFQRLGGTWSGAGTATVSNGAPEQLRCLAAYAPGGEANVQLQLVCASDSYKLQVRSNLERQGDRIDGNWSEASTGASGSVRGSIRGNRLDANVDGAGLTARLTLALRGQSQAVTLVSGEPLATSATVVLRRR